MSDLVPWDDDYQYVPPSSIEEALSPKLLHTFPGNRGDLIDLFKALERASDTPWRTFGCTALAGTIGIAIRAYSEKTRSHGYEPRKVELEIRRAKKLAKELRKILMMKEGQERYAPVIERGYPRSEIEAVLGPDISKNTLLNLLMEISENGPLSVDAARSYPVSDQSLVAQHRDQVMRPTRELIDNSQVGAMDRVARDQVRQSAEGSIILGRIDSLWASYSGPKAQDSIRHQLMVSSIIDLAVILGPNVRRSLIEGRNVPWSLLKSLVLMIVEFVGSHKGAPELAPGQDSSAFNNALKYACLLSQDDDLRHQLRRLEAEYRRRLLIAGNDNATDE